MKYKGYLIVVVFLSSFSFRAFSSEFFIAPEVGYSNLEFDGQFSLDGNSDSTDGVALGMSAGYQFDSNLLVEANISSTSNYDFLGAFDKYTVNEFKLLLGYRIHLSKYVKIIPKVGYSIWDLEAEEGQFLNAGPEDEINLSGKDLFGQISMQFSTTDNFHIYLYHSHYDIEFGEMATSGVGFKINF